MLYFVHGEHILKKRTSFRYRIVQKSNSNSQHLTVEQSPVGVRIGVVYHRESG